LRIAFSPHCFDLEEKMMGKTKYLMIASMDVDPEYDALFHEVYDQDHIPTLLKVPGVLSVTRYKRGKVVMNFGGDIKTLDIGDAPGYSAVYELEHPDVLVSEEWAKAVELGRWSTEVRPHTRNRRHILLTLIEPS
jgi:hypothetical protein